MDNIHYKDLTDKEFDDVVDKFFKNEVFKDWIFHKKDDYTTLYSCVFNNTQWIKHEIYPKLTCKEMLEVFKNIPTYFKKIQENVKDFQLIKKEENEDIFMFIINFPFFFMSDRYSVTHRKWKNTGEGDDFYVISKSVDKSPYKVDISEKIVEIKTYTARKIESAKGGCKITTFFTRDIGGYVPSKIVNIVMKKRPFGEVKRWIEMNELIKKE